MENLILDLDKVGAKVFIDLPLKEPKKLNHITLDDFALIDELSGLNLFLDNFMQTHNLPQTVRDRIRARTLRYSGDKPKKEAIMELKEKIYGNY